MIINKGYNVDLHIRIPMPLDQKIMTYCNNLNKNSKVEGIKELLEIGLFTVENWSLIKKDPNRIEEIHKQLKEGQLVDEIQNMEHRDFAIIYDIFKTEHKARYGSSSNSVESYISSKLESGE